MGAKDEKAGPDDLRRTVQELIMGVLSRKRLPVRLEDIKEGVSLTKGLGIDSLDILQISAIVEKKYKIKIPEEEFRMMDDLRAILRVVRKYLPGSA